MKEYQVVTTKIVRAKDAFEAVEQSAAIVPSEIIATERSKGVEITVAEGALRLDPDEISEMVSKLSRGLRYQ